METSTLHHISLAQFKEFFPTSPCVGFGDEFYILDARPDECLDILNHSCRFDGYMFFYFVKGHMKVNVNLMELEMAEGMISINVPGNIIRVNDIIGIAQDEVRCVCLAMSKDFAAGLKVELGRLFNDEVSLLDRPGVLLGKTECELAAVIMRHIIAVIKSDIPYKRESVISSLSSMLYILMGAWKSDAPAADVEYQSKRSKAIFDRFVALVVEYHTQQRTVGFYAKKLSLTPKYLSKLVKNVTGRSAPEWIDSYVILEAKNLLKYSGVTIKEIVYRLNFPNQSVFYKFFKARTGMTPSEFRNS